MERKTERIRLEGIQRRIAIKVVAGYRTASTEAVLVLAGVFPILIIAKEWRLIYDRWNTREAQDKAWDMWRDEWSATGKWTRRQIPRVRVWVERNFEDFEHFAVQFFTGHGCFEVYLKRFGIAKTDGCVYYDKMNTPAHTVFSYERWETQRRICYAGTGILTTGKIAGKMLRSENGWKAIHGFIGEVMKQKNSEEKALRLEKKKELFRDAGEEEDEELAYFGSVLLEFRGLALNGAQSRPPWEF